MVIGDAINPTNGFTFGSDFELIREISQNRSLTS